MFLIGAAYFGWAWLARDTHLHFNDGTFSLSAPFAEVWTRSFGRLLWVWGFVALALAAFKVVRPKARLLALSLGWIGVTLLPYSFLTYMLRVPSRHTYLASAGVALLLAASLLALRQSKLHARRAWIAPALATMIVASESAYLWTVIHDRYVLRARPTEMLIEASRRERTIYASCFPYAPILAQSVFNVLYPDSEHPKFLAGPEPARHPDARDFCNEIAEGPRYSE